MTNKVILTFDITIESDTADEGVMDEIGEYIATDLFMSIDNGDDFLEVKYKGCGKPK